MIRQRRGFWLWILVPLLLIVTAPAGAQEETQSDQIDESFLEAESRPEIEEYLEGDMEVLAGEGTTYDPGDRRDPFLSLAMARESRDNRGPRPEGIPGLMIDDIEVTGIFMTAQGAVAQVRVSDKRQSYLLREGDQLYDGDVTSISFEEVVFKQILEDPSALKPFRPVVKELRPQGDS
jgi:Tfp pilus assembly protein PilP